MSFSFEFIAKKEDVSALLDKEAANPWNPPYVIQFVRAACENLNCDIIQVKAHGHLYTGPNDYERSSITLEVLPVRLTPRP